MRDDGRPDHIEDALIVLHSKQWFTWTDSKNKIYANLEITDGGYKPTEQECIDGLKAMQDAWDAANT